MNDIPEQIQKQIEGKSYVVDHMGMSDSRVWIFEDTVLKVQPISEETENEYQIINWLENKLPVPQILSCEKQEDMVYLLMSRIKGKMSCNEYYMKNPKLLVQVLVDGLKKLWSIPVSDCPCDNRLRRKLRYAWQNVELGLVDMENVEPETYGENGFENPEELLQWLCENCPEEEIVLSHGDYCLPNILAEGNSVCGFLDLGKMGKADKWQDIALCYRSLKHNFDGKYNGIAYGDFEADLLFEKLEIEPDWEKIRYYILLDELF